MVYEFRFPDVGEGITEGEIVKWLVKEKDKIKENDNLVQVETDKSIVDIPSPKNGKILKLHFREGDTIKVGDVIVTIDDGIGQLPPQKSVNGKIEEEPRKRRSVSVVGELEEAEDNHVSTSEISEESGKPKVCKLGEICEPEVKEFVSRSGILAVPKVRSLAKKLGVDINEVKTSGENGRITEDDVIAASKEKQVSVLVESEHTLAKIEEVKKIRVIKKYDMWGYVDRIPLKGVRRTVARNIIRSFQSAASVTAMIDIDVTKLWGLREKEKSKAGEKGIKLTFFPFIIRAVIEGLKKHPYLNSEFTDEEIIVKKYYNIGIAVDTEVGLIVPVIKRAETKNLYDIAREINELAEKAKKRTLDLMDMKGGSFTITNYGSIGSNYGTPIINPPEAAILGLGRIFDRVTLNDKKIENRKILPLSLTFDHRILDGAEAARFLNTIKDYLEEPERIRFEGDKK